MAKTEKPSVNAKLESVFSETPPANPAPTPADKKFLIGLKKRGYTQDEIIRIAEKAGFKIEPELFAVVPKSVKTT